VLYLHVGDPSTDVDFDESQEGHALRFDSAGCLVGLTIIGVKSRLSRSLWKFVVAVGGVMVTRWRA
jgi:hypothetical protein